MSFIDSSIGGVDLSDLAKAANVVTKQPATPTAADTAPPGKQLMQVSDGLKIYEPPQKDPMDQIVHTMERIEALKNPGAPASGYANAFSPASDQFYVETGNANVRQLENLAGLFSAPPEGPRESNVPLIVLALVVVGLGYYFLKGK